MKWTIKAAIGIAILTLIVLLGSGYNSEAASKSATRTPHGNLKGLVVDSKKVPIEGATVYAIPASILDLSPITPAAITSGAAETVDEPLEDIVNDPVKVKTLAKGVSNKKGQFTIKGIDLSASYFFFTVPAVADTNHLPGGDLSRAAITPRSPAARKAGGLTIHMSWNTPLESTYIGTTACYTCHGPGSTSDVSSNKHHGHALMFHKPGAAAGDTPNQDSTGHQGASWNELANRFTVATAYNKPLTGTTVETLYVTEYNATAASNNGQSFAIYENHASTVVDPTLTPAGTTYKTILKYYLWRTGTTAADKYYMTIENVSNVKDPNNLVTLEVPFFMGGYLRQKAFVKVPGLKSPYGAPINFYAVPGSASQGLETSYDRSRRPFVDSLFGQTNGFATIAVTSNGNIATLKVSNKTNTVESLTGSNKVAPTAVSCAACHLGFGSYTNFNDAATGELLSHTVDDPNGAVDLASDGNLQDVGINCEQCHGAGSSHRDAMLAAPKGSAKYIVNPKLLGADRASLICGRCHDPRGILKDEEADFPPVGISRAQYLANYVNPAQKSFTAAGLYPDAMHGKGGHHGVTYENYLCSKHARNNVKMLACDDCHDAMGDSPYRYSLKGDPDNSRLGEGLCNQCHNRDIGQHALDKTGSIMKNGSMTCISCHMTRTGKGGAGRPGLLIGTPTGLQTDANLEYWEGDQSSHVFDVIHKSDKGVSGTVPGSAMPAPYVNSCGTCHDASKLQFQAPQ